MARAEISHGWRSNLSVQSIIRRVTGIKVKIEPIMKTEMIDTIKVMDYGDFPSGPVAEIPCSCLFAKKVRYNGTTHTAQ